MSCAVPDEAPTPGTPPPSPTPLPLLPPMPSRMGTMTRWTVVLGLAEVWRIKE